MYRRWSPTGMVRRSNVAVAECLNQPCLLGGAGDERDILPVRLDDEIGTDSRSSPHHGSPMSSATSSAPWSRRHIGNPGKRTRPLAANSGGARRDRQARPHSRPQRGRVGNGAAAFTIRIRAVSRLAMAAHASELEHPDRSLGRRRSDGGPARCLAVTNYSQAVTNYSLTPTQGF
jgi:hypothetical protein